MWQGGKVGSTDQKDKVRLVNVGGREMLWYEAPRRMHVALLRGTSADLDGNISYEREPLVLDNLNQVTGSLCLQHPAAVTFLDGILMQGYQLLLLGDHASLHLLHQSRLLVSGQGLSKKPWQAGCSRLKDAVH